MNSLGDKVLSLKKSGKKALSFFLTGCWPSKGGFMDLVRFIDENSLADFIEVGVPFSDPLADGPVLQNASRDALEAGISFGSVLEATAELCPLISMPMVLMTYLNVLVAGGVENNIRRAGEAGFQGIIVPDLPLEESAMVAGPAAVRGMGTVLLAAPSTPAGRLRAISEKSSPFLYYVSSFGVTGARSGFQEGLKERLSLAAELSASPVYCGFGISTPRQARLAAGFSDGIIIGSALTRKIASSNAGDFKLIKKFAINIRKEIVR